MLDNAGVTGDALDPRVRRTREQLRSAMRRLLRDRDPDRISVTGITSAAKIARPTFYLHYSCPDDLLAETVRQDLDGLTGVSRTVLDDGNTPLAVLALVAEANRARWLYRCLVGQNTPFGRSREVLVTHLTEGVGELIARRRPDLPQDAVQEAARFAAGGILCLLTTWLSSPEPVTEAEELIFGARVWRLSSGVLGTLAA